MTANRKLLGGFSLLELVVVLAIVAILVALAAPAYTRYIRKANRGEAQQLLMNWANNQEIWRANNTTYAGTGNLAAPLHDKYTFTIGGVSATAYTITATAKAGTDQVNDEQESTSCTPLTLNQSGAKGPAVCW